MPLGNQNEEIKKMRREKTSYLVWGINRKYNNSLLIFLPGSNSILSVAIIVDVILQLLFKSVLRCGFLFDFFSIEPFTY